MPTTRHLATVITAALGLTGCEPDDVIRNVELAGDVALPEGSSALVGDTLRVAFEAVEPVNAGTRFVVWVDTMAGRVAIAETAAPGTVEVVLGDVGLTIADLDGVAVSEEPTGAGLPAGPASAVFFEGDVVGELELGGLDHHDFEGIDGTAELHDEELHLMATGLPALPEGFYYGVWLSFAAPGGHHQAGVDAGAGDGPTMMMMGELDGTGMLETMGAMILGGASSVAVTIESANGVDMMSTSRVLSGDVRFTTGTTAPAGGGHMH